VRQDLPARGEYAPDRHPEAGVRIRHERGRHRN
jgi:hypothetical protein